MQDNRSRLQTTICAYRRDPTDGILCGFAGDCDWDGERVAELFETIALTFDVSFNEIDRMARIASLGLEAFDYKCDPFEKLEKLSREAEYDNHSLSFSLSIQEALEIWRRARAGLRWFAEHHPDASKRTMIKKFLAEREAVMKRLRRSLDNLAE
jgi:hypothetical protein